LARLKSQKTSLFWPNDFRNRNTSKKPTTSATQTNPKSTQNHKCRNIANHRCSQIKFIPTDKIQRQNWSTTKMASHTPTYSSKTIFQANNTKSYRLTKEFKGEMFHIHRLKLSTIVHPWPKSMRKSLLYLQAQHHSDGTVHSKQEGQMIKHSLFIKFCLTKYQAALLHSKTTIRWATTLTNFC
jgi:hypothetical protein